ncbi:threonine dehydratase [Candidatus Roizmanbacteria bacterium RIFCSPLOWO2_01_FULL_38_12]|uniref:L-threonine dehydratase n=1 Tax=Candidatus Roizmanbacteria bacterium RIFCSPLOWO2_01_FULL_38_12 TaxID=1802061 RepID=A0A1F7IRB7_9BACT|nr:MAG: threonine dehydratase [Candidatus Roizmanbacteria bacterium RIFCSPHIGHO2_01_FULL_38_15]OGK35418.1 MAG: threonine dehydratase [Candidatus Roizmanbacteria bacterium RIFCSPHIGHO2_12_FULL_38_13]OGK45894.1 MAG: threonine dehydratase [Candidatus Roizmanbacteria bacterium RIFCSPLOWO2_01_FULL_38_12]
MKITIKDIEDAAKRLKDIAQKTPLQYSKRLSKKYKADIYIKREDLQEVRSFKIRGAYNKMSCLSNEEKKRGVVCASAGNHAQGVAYSCNALKIKGVIFMPVVTPNQKIEKVKHFGGKYTEVRLVGNTFDDASVASKVFTKENNMVYVHPFNDPLTIAGQGTVGKEIYEKLDGKIDYLISTIGGGGLICGVSTYLKNKNKKIKCIGVEPEGAASMYEALKKGKVVTLEKIDTFVDGAAVKTVGELTYKICRQNLEKVIRVPSGKDCTAMIELYQNEGIIAEPAGALAVASLDDLAQNIKGKTVVCIISGGNNDILRYPEIMERSLVYQGRKHYFIIEFAQKPGQLRKFVDQALGPTDDIVRFEYIKKTNKEKGPALVGIELRDRKDLQPLLDRMKEIELNYRKITNSDLLYDYLV